jgi:TPR repeat protein
MRRKLLDINKLTADQHHAPAQRRYAICRATRRGVAKNDAEAARYCKLAADQNDASAEFSYAPCLANGKVVAANEPEAARYDKLAANCNDALA